MRFVVHQLSALQGAAKLAADWREARQWYLLEGDALGAANADRYAWVYEHAAALLVPALMDRPEPQYEDFEPEAPIEPDPVFLLREVEDETYLPKVIVAPEPVEVTRPALRLLKGGWFQEDETVSSAG